MEGTEFYIKLFESYANATNELYQLRLKVDDDFFWRKYNEAVLKEYDKWVMTDGWYEAYHIILQQRVREIEMNILKRNIGLSMYKTTGCFPIDSAHPTIRTKTLKERVLLIILKDDFYKVFKDFNRLVFKVNVNWKY